MKLKFEASRKRRLKSYGYIWAEMHPNTLDYSYIVESKKWYLVDPTLDDNEMPKGSYSSCVDCKSVRAFRRRLRKWDGLFNGAKIEFRLASRFHGKRDVFGYVNKPERRKTAKRKRENAAGFKEVIKLLLDDNISQEAFVSKLSTKKMFEAKSSLLNTLSGKIKCID